MFCLAGAAPSTRQSGRVKIVSFRWAADKQLRDAVCDFASDSRRANPWAAKLYTDAIARGHDHPHAVRILARAWLYIIYTDKRWRILPDGGMAPGLTQGYSRGHIVRRPSGSSASAV